MKGTLNSYYQDQGFPLDRILCQLKFRLDELSGLHNVGWSAQLRRPDLLLHQVFITHKNAMMLNATSLPW